MYTCLEPCFLKACWIVHLMWNAHTVSSHSCYTCLDPIVLEVCVTMAWSRILPWAFIAWLQVAEVDLQVDFSERQFLSIGLVSQSLAICKLRSERQKVRLFLLAWNLFSTLACVWLWTFLVTSETLVLWSVSGVKAIGCEMHLLQVRLCLCQARDKLKWFSIEFLNVFRNASLLLLMLQKVNPKFPEYALVLEWCFF